MMKFNYSVLLLKNFYNVPSSIYFGNDPTPVEITTSSFVDHPIIYSEYLEVTGHLLNGKIVFDNNSNL